MEHPKIGDRDVILTLGLILEAFRAVPSTILHLQNCVEIDLPLTFLTTVSGMVTIEQKKIFRRRPECVPILHQLPLLAGCMLHYPYHNHARQCMQFCESKP